jgi:hypothetical protein
MQDGEGSNDDGQPLATNRTIEAVVALLLLAVCVIVIADSARLGFNWREGEGPAPGYFPFYIAVILGVASLVNLFSALRGRGSGVTFVSSRPLGRVLSVLVPSVVYVALIQYAGIYVASALFIATFMVLIGQQNILKALVVGISIPIVLFFTFERWFLVPLPKGPLEALLGY